MGPKLALMFITMLYIHLTLLLSPSRAHDETPSRYQQENGGDEILSILRLPRRLKMSEEAVVVVKGYSTDRDMKTHKQNEGYNTSGNRGQGEDEVTGQEYRVKSVAGTSHFFTMDYAPVRRRRPIHNKSLPDSP